MSPSFTEVEAQRARWVRYRDNQGLVSTPSSEFAQGAWLDTSRISISASCSFPPTPKRWWSPSTANVLTQLVDLVPGCIRG